MVTLLKLILCALQTLAAAIGVLLVKVINLVIVALGGFIQLVLLILPPMPDPPAKPDDGALGFINWVLPLGGLVGGLMTFVTLWALIVVGRVALKWAKAL